MSALSNDQGRAYEFIFRDKNSLDYIHYAGLNFPCRYIPMNDGYTYLVSVESLNNALYNNKTGYPSKEAQQIDEKIFFFLQDKDIYRPTHEIVKILSKVIA